MQMLCGGGMLFIAVILNSDFSRLSMRAISTQSVVAFLYLTFFGSIVAFTAYSWLLKAASPSRAITSSYVNPVVAVILGWALAGEAITYRMLWAMITILLGVVVITSAKTRTT
jgi:drug/metabolite transporter (DMT)-like permease